MKAQVAYQSDSDAIPVARVNGITSVAVVPSGGLIGGQVAVMNLDGWTWEEATLQAGRRRQLPVPAARCAAAVVAAAAAAADAEPQVRGSQEGARRAREARRGSDRAGARLREDCRPPSARTDWNLEALVPIAERPAAAVRRRPTTKRDIREAVAFADRAGVQIVITGGLESPLVAPLLKEKNIPVILGSVLTLPAREDAHHAATYRAAGELAQAGVKFAFGTGGAANNRLIALRGGDLGGVGPRSRPRAARHHARRRRRSSASPIASARSSPARSPTSFIANGDPMEMKTQFTHIFINGRSVGLEEQTHRALRALLVASGGGEVMTSDLRLAVSEVDWRLAVAGFALPLRSLSAQQEAPYIVRDHRARASCRCRRRTIDNGTVVFSRRRDHRGRRQRHRACRARSPSPARA